MNARFRSLSFLVASLALVACHKNAPTTTVALPSRDPNAMVALAALAEPTEVAFVRTNLDAARASGYFAPLLERVRASGGSNDAESEYLFALLSRTSEAFASFQKSHTPGGDPDLAVIVGRGQYSPDDIARLDSMMSSTRTQIAHGPYQLHCDVQKCAALVGTHTLVIGLRDAVVGVLDRQAVGGGGAYTNDADLQSVLTTTGADRADITIGCTSDPSLIRILRNGFDFPPDVVESMKAGAASIGVSSGLSIRARVRTSSAVSAEHGAAHLRAPVDSARRNPMMQAFGLRDVLDAIHIGPEGNDVVASLDLSDARVRQLLTMLEGILDSSPR